MSLSTPITVLILEDLAEDRELLLHELRRQGLDPRPLPVTGEGDYRAALEQHPEVILADYRLPAFSAERALEILAEQELDIPLIVVSGYIGEEKAVELMRRGAADYLLKDRLGRLGAAVTQAIDNRCLRRERELSTAALRFGEERFRLALNQIPLPFALYDENLCIRFANESCTRFFGQPEERIIGHDCRDFFPEEISSQLYPHLLAARESGQPRTAECLIPLPDGEHSFRISYVPLGHDETLAVAVDITEWQRMERLKDELLASVSHEMRSPLTAILGFTEFMQGTEVPRALQLEYLGIIRQEGERLKELVENLLDLQRLQAGFDQRNLTAISVHSLLSRLRERFLSLQPQRNFQLNCPLDLPLLRGNEPHLYRALENLLNNAVKYTTEEKAITLGARLDKENILLWVRDLGEGLDPALHEKIFQRFFRATSAVGGTGLGLALVREIAREHGGQAWVESTPGEGCTFYLRLPLA
ncbi:sensor histidine kinase [Desulfuromonas acetexigens]|uniref:histidine kinase n=1 Tax=Trichloromonas acetexigens TaxID=38815 RepID=A0A550JDD5_9BACT|nr:ATP-binding protein [Desulfuromonas acetexigens]TRO81217.1 PAS domain-containing protein [Desulfuromonas acetexigens]